MGRWIIIMYTIEARLITTDKKEFYLNKVFDVKRKITNHIFSYVTKIVNLMSKTNGINIKKIYKNKSLTQTQKNKQIRFILNKYRLTEYALHDDLKWMSKYYCMNTSLIQKLITELYPAIKSFIFKNSSLKFKPKDNYINTSLSAKAKTGLTLIKEDDNYYVLYNSTHKAKNKIRLKLKLHINKHDYYLRQMLDENYDLYKYVRLIRRCEKGKNKYYIQIIVPGSPPIKYSKQGEVKGISNLGLESKGNVGIDIGTSTITTVSGNNIYKHELGCYKRKKESYIKKIKELNQYKRELDRLRIKNNPLFYNKNGTKKSKAKIISENLNWKESKRMLKLRLKIKECYRLVSEYVKLDHNQFINNLIKQGLIFKVEDMNFQALAKRSKKKTEISLKTGKYKRKKRYGKSIGFHSPGLLLSLLNKKLNYKEQELIKVNTKIVKASQYNHLTRTFNKKELKDREITIDNNKIDRDIYSAYLISEIDYDKTYKENEKDANRWVKYNNNNLERRFNKFLRINKHHIENKINKDGIKREIIYKKGIGIISIVV